MRPHHAKGNSVGSVCDTAASSAIRTFEYLMEKYCPVRVVPLPRRPKPWRQQVVIGEFKSNRRKVMTKEEHDKIVQLHRQQHLTVAQLSEQFHRSRSVVWNIVNGFHKFGRAA